jgi:hypothetical protein
MIKKTTILSLVFMVGCAGYNNSYKCDPAKGERCKSISTINKMIDSGAIKSNTTNSVVTNSKPMVIGGSVVRQPEIVMNVWLSPYTDQYGIYHNSNNLRAVVKEARWGQEKK